MDNKKRKRPESATVEGAGMETPVKKLFDQPLARFKTALFNLIYLNEKWLAADETRMVLSYVALEHQLAVEAISTGSREPPIHVTCCDINHEAADTANSWLMSNDIRLRANGSDALFTIHFLPTKPLEPICIIISSFCPEFPDEDPKMGKLLVGTLLRYIAGTGNKQTLALYHESELAKQHGYAIVSVLGGLGTPLFKLVFDSIVLYSCSITL
jgi:hypothetical protein